MCYNNVERYDPSADTWKQVANLKIHRGGVCAVTLNGEVYAIGGNDGVQSKVWIIGISYDVLFPWYKIFIYENSILGMLWEI